MNIQIGQKKISSQGIFLDMLDSKGGVTIEDNVWIGSTNKTVILEWITYL